MDEWRREISTQAERLSSEFVEAVRAKVQNTPMKVEWGEAKYLGEVMGRFVEGMNPRLKKDLEIKERGENDNKGVLTR